MQNPPALALLAPTPPDLVACPVEFAPYESTLPPAAVQSPGVNTRPKGEITLLRAKRKSGAALTEEEKAKLRDYYRRDGRRKRGIHLNGGREEQWTLLAEKQGVSFSAWVQERVE